ncbi:MAG: ATP-binding protein [Xenococcaceae cyanobacterium]
MATIDEIIQREVNPFDPVTFKTGNFWLEDNPASALTVESINQEAINQITEVLDLVARDNYTRTVMLAGDSGSGKSYLLGRLKKTLNSKAFFAYIDPCPSSDYIWRHTLRYTVDSLMQTPEGEKESQLILWLKSLSAFRDRSLMRRLLGERGLFILNFRSTYPAGIYQSKEFFGTLYNLINPDLYFLACDWLRGENLDGDEMKALGVRSTIDNEEAAQGILGNFGRIAASTQPIVLCFDQVENAAPLPDGTPNLQPLFNVNSTFHNQNLKNFLVIISILNDKWRIIKKHIEQSDMARIETQVSLKSINLEQAEALWASRLYTLHHQANSQPLSPIYPLDRQVLEEKYPGGKANVRNVLALGSKLFLKYKLGREPDQEDSVAAFKLIWSKEFNKTQQKTSRIRQFSSLELIEMLKRAIIALEVEVIESKLLSSKVYASYSFSYQHQLPDKFEKRGIFWNEAPNMKSFYYAMKACEKAIKEKLCNSLILIRAEKLGQARNKGYQLFQQIFKSSPHRHIPPHLDSVHYLKTYQRLVNDACAGDLVVGFKTINLQELEELIRKSKVLHDCPLLQDLKIVSPNGNNKLCKIKECLLNILATQYVIGRKVLIKNVHDNFSHISKAEIDEILQNLYDENEVTIANPKDQRENQSICWIPKK